MKTKTSRTAVRTIERAELNLDGDLVEKISRRVINSRKDEDVTKRFYSIGDYIERNLWKSIEVDEKEYGEIPVTLSGVNGNNTK